MKAGKKTENLRAQTGIYLGVDGGGTRTTAWVSDAGSRVLGRGVAGPANPVKVGLRAAQQEILSASTRALRSASARPGNLESVCLGLAGADRAEVSGPLAKWIGKRLPARFQLVTTDAAIALAAAHDLLPTILLIAGTGSIACARDSEGNLVRAGGWGSSFDDAGSGYDIGRQAVHAALRALDGRGAPTSLVRALPRALRLHDLREVAGLRLGPAEIAALAPVVVNRAHAGDRVARNILENAGAELASLALALIRRLELEEQPVAVVGAGGLLQSSTALRRIVARHLRARAPKARLSRLDREPVEGALALARQGIRASISSQADESGWPSRLSLYSQGIGRVHRSGTPRGQETRRH